LISLVYILKETFLQHRKRASQLGNHEDLNHRFLANKIVRQINWYWYFSAFQSPLLRCGYGCCL